MPSNPNNSKEINKDVIGQLVTPQNTPIIPQDATSVMGKPNQDATTQPKAAPMQKDGTISPPLKPAPNVNAVKIIFNKNLSKNKIVY